MLMFICLRYALLFIYFLFIEFFNAASAGEQNPSLHDCF